MPLSPGTRLGRYLIAAPLGAGGMGEVYRAEDTLLKRQVAVKVLPEHLAKNPEALKRFQKEAKALAALSHSNIVAIHDFVTEHDCSFVVMELLEGQTLRSRMAKLPLPWQKSVEIAISIAEGLAAAHSKGVVHRDLKPENILLTSQGGLKILDFGLARLKPIAAEEELTQSPTISRVTESGIVMGTVPYMSPEQVRGELADALSDVFSFGCVLYEMLAGKRPFSGSTGAETTAAILRDDPPKLTSIPSELDRIVQHCLEKEPERRLHSTHDLAFELKELLASPSNRAEATAQPLPGRRRSVMIAAAVILFTALIAVIIVLRSRQSTPPAEEKIESLAVLPLKNLSDDPKQEYFADGMTEELIAKLARISALRVISRTSVMEYKGAHKPLPEIAKELNVDAILEGSVLHSGDRVRITAQLIHAPTDRHLWAETYERDLTDILALQNDVASSVVQEIQAKLTPEEQTQLAVAPKVNPAAYETYLRGVYYASRSQGTIDERRLAITMFERAIEIDSNFAQAYARLSMVYSSMYHFPWMYHTFIDRTSETLAKAKQAVDRAYQLQPQLPEAHIAMGYYYYWGFKNYEQALREFTIAQKAIPNDKQLLLGFAAIYRRQGKFQAALQGFRKTLEVDPRDASTAVELAITYDIVGDYDQAQRYLDLAISLGPDQPGTYEEKVRVCLKWTGDTKDARAIVIKIPDENFRRDYLRLLEMLDRNYQGALDLLPLATQKSYANAILAGDAYRLMKKPSMARKSYEAACIELERLVKESPADYDLHSWLSFAYAGLNRKEEAIREANKAAELYPVSKDAFWGPRLVRNQAIIYVMVGEYQAAMDKIEYLFSIPTSRLDAPSVPMLRVDPTWDPLRTHPRFHEILEKYSDSSAR